MKAIRRAALGAAMAMMIVLSGLHLWFDSVLTGPPPEYRDSSEHTEYYFAYGSNMSPQYLGHIRGVEVQWASAATLRDYRVEFGLNGINWLEPAFANLRPAPGETAVGVIHRLSQDGIDMIAGSEGDEYEWTEVTVLTPDEERLTAWTLVANPANPATDKPSRRYLEIMHSAARFYDFPDRELERLDPDQGVYVPVLSELMGVVIQSVTWMTARY